TGIIIFIVSVFIFSIFIAETQAFKLIKNSKQLVSYAGYDVVENQSGTSVRGKTRISKKGNSRIRAALYLPSVVASNHNKPMKIMYDRLNTTKTNKKISLTAIQRKLLVLMFSMWKNDTVFEENRQTISLPAQDDHKDLLH
ncbi:MAG: IS110 family transposase, partial [Chitinophagaceae bacterium]|nr:IS110 family transposase [Chitinophagaceae bacterium]